MKKFRKHLPLSFFALTAGSVISLSAMGFVPKNGTIEGQKFIQSPLSLSSISFKNWGLQPNNNANISAVKAWSVTEGNKNVVVAVVDTGIDSGHPDLQPNLWNDPSNKSARIYGWSFVENKPNPTDEHGHGTHISGIIGAVVNPKMGIGGVAHHVSIMPVKYYSENASGATNLRNTIRALNWAIDHGARIINYSGGGPQFCQEEYDAMKRAEEKGILVVAAAGNERQDTDLIENRYFPAAYRLKNIISVTATDLNNRILASSNWGKRTVDVAAPGENIYSTLPGGRYGYLTGTSQATAFVTGIAALILSQRPDLRPEQVRQIIMDSVDGMPQLGEKVASGGRVNAYKALFSLSPKVQPLDLLQKPNYQLGSAR